MVRAAAAGLQLHWDQHIGLSSNNLDGAYCALLGGAVIHEIVQLASPPSLLTL